MTNYIKTYHGADIFEISFMDITDGNLLNHKIVAKAKLPNQTNVIVDFIETSRTRQRAVAKVQNAIDQYLKEHDLISFASGSLYGAE